MSNRTRITTFGALVLLVLGPAAAIAGIHTWDVGEVFSNADGTIQFVEFVEAGGGNFETGIANGSTSSNAGPKSFSWTSPPVTNTANKRFLVGSQTFANLTGAPPVNAIMPLSVLPFFFQPASDTVNFAVYDSCVFTAIPTNGIGSRDCVANTNQTANSPTNYAGTAGSVIATLAPGLLDNFQNGTLQNWIGGGVNQANGGPAGAGDRYLEFTAVVSPLSVFNESQWAGDAIASGASSIDVDLNNIGPGSLSVRVMLLTPGCEFGGTACTAWTSAGAVPLPPSSGWAAVSFSLQEADLIRVLGSDSYVASLANVERVLIRHDDGPADPPDITPLASSTLGMDNIELPEPSGLLGLLAGVALIHLLRRRG